ncbi:MAG: transcriptional coactivator p15/PC4 family protein [Candidatus Omnitrophica bacterium]|nr:transcriptional coactivator p15/PC4 family protein [Candidatus Omnitrophota bacterium]
MQKVVKTIEKNKFQEVRVGISEFKGNDLIDIRIWNTVKDSDEKSPTAKGVSLNVALYPELKEAILELEKELKKNNLIT